MPEDRNCKAPKTTCVLAPPTVRALLLPPTKGRKGFVGGLPNQTSRTELLSLFYQLGLFSLRVPVGLDIW